MASVSKGDICIVSLVAFSMSQNYLVTSCCFVVLFLLIFDAITVPRQTVASLLLFFCFKSNDDVVYQNGCGCSENSGIPLVFDNLLNYA